ncbi:RNA-binding protein 25 [Trachymyrmex zeteki]|uniref:RNA-binding protein 25 n=1 Tax=Mycetomoellerius zeteki TaxID=64791 RepID=A0A151WMA5_9HYME|nr:RNA-binding protein 25 [Trachymyrmex zeteki]
MIPSPVSAMQTSAPAVRYSRNQNRHDNNRRRERESGPPVTVFIGNIMDRAPDVMIRHILGACGHVLSWKRVQAFGFCEYAGPDAGLRAVRLLHDMEIGTKKLVVKVDAKAKVVLDQFKAERRKKLRGGQSPLQDETPSEGADGEEGEDYMDEGMRVVDADALTRINQIIAEHAADLEMAQVAPEEHQTKMVAKSLNLDETEIEESKRDLITREIGKFREVMKKQEEEKAQVKRKKEAVEKEEREKREKERRDKRDDDASKDDQDGDPSSPTDFVVLDNFFFIVSGHNLKAEREEQYKPKPVITIIDEEDEKAKKDKEVMPPIETEPIESDSDDGVQFDDVSQPEAPSRTPPRHHHHHRRHHRHHQNHHRDGNFVPFAMGSGGNRASDHSIGGKTPVSPNTAANTNSQQTNQTRKKGRIDVKDVFNNDDDDDTTNNAKKRKLVPLGKLRYLKIYICMYVYISSDYGDEKKKKTEEVTKAGKEENTKSQEEKRKHIKSLIDKIPTDKNALFGYQLDWALIDNTLMEKRIRPWINKKIIEYIGEPEPTLVDFICSKVMAGSSPQGILDDVQMVLDEEAEVFVVKMWRLLIYEVEAKKMGLVK